METSTRKAPRRSHPARPWRGVNWLELQANVVTRDRSQRDLRQGCLTPAGAPQAYGHEGRDLPGAHLRCSPDLQPVPLLRLRWSWCRRSFREAPGRQGSDDDLAKDGRPDLGRLGEGCDASRGQGRAQASRLQCGQDAAPRQNGSNLMMKSGRSGNIQMGWGHEVEPAHARSNAKEDP